MRWLPLPLLLVGCDLSDPGSGVSDGVGAELTSFSGCADIHLYASNDHDTIALFVTLPEGLIDEARAQGGSTTFAFGLPAPDFPVVQLQEGENLTTTECTDVIDGDSLPEIDRTWVASSGSVEGEVTATGEAEPWNNPGTVTVELTDVVLESDGESVELGQVTFEDIAVGWLAG